MKINTALLKKIFMYLFYILLSVAILAVVLQANDIEEIFSNLIQADFKFIIFAVLCVLAYLALYPLSLCIITHARRVKIRPATTYGIAMTEHFFNSITPFSTGGQPFQVYCFSRARVKAAESTCILLMNFMVFMMVTNGFAISSLFFANRFVFDHIHLIPLAAVGFTLNFCVLAITFLVATNKHICQLFCKVLELLCTICKPLDAFCNRLFHKAPLVKRIVKRIRPQADACMPFYKRVRPWVDSTELYFVQVQEAFGLLMKRKGHFLLALISKIFSMGFLYLATYFILLALGVSITPDNIFFVVCGTSFAITMVVFMPTPGSSGGIEAAFKDVFSSVISGTGADPTVIATTTMLIWRLLTYYLVMGISFLFYIILEVYFSVKNKASKASDEDFCEECDDETPAILAVGSQKKERRCCDCTVKDSCKSKNLKDNTSAITENLEGAIDE